jgi:hypothetical protein
LKFIEIRKSKILPKNKNKHKKMTTIRVKELEKLIDRDRNTILRWEREGRIPHAQKDSRGWRFYTKYDVDAIIRFAAGSNYYGRRF